MKRSRRCSHELVVDEFSRLDSEIRSAQDELANVIEAVADMRPIFSVIIDQRIREDLDAVHLVIHRNEDRTVGFGGVVMRVQAVGSVACREHDSPFSLVCRRGGVVPSC